MGSLVKWTTYVDTGRVGDNKALSNLVCGLVESPECINPEHKVGHIYGESDPGKKEENLLIQKFKVIIMPRGQMTRYEILSRVYKLKDELKDRQEETENKYLWR